jgi:hypothetical protein
MKTADYIEIYKNTPGLGTTKAMYQAVPHKQGNGLAPLPARKDEDGDPVCIVAEIRVMEPNGKVLTPGYVRIAHEQPVAPKNTTKKDA